MYHYVTASIMHSPSNPRPNKWMCTKETYLLSQAQIHPEPMHVDG
ncbi:hypothetical protein MUK42_18380 [Musa troglodytarum]|uniref:Uncharacterized protein n=1 Tax=Musa troglodytarum TaxID=320322 RepID=A0A9E7G1P4_9LILI|nr:hypothetical protein MUK42_18380 [Musa troglodytarum]